jgi:hypothetical protein
MKTYVYVDGFNLYYGCIKGTPYKWLDIDALCQKLLPKNDIVKIKYFTARVSARSHDPDQPVRQQAYLRALETIPHLQIIYGHFLTNTIKMPVANCPPGKQRYETVIKTEEKGSDVNIATHLLWDGFQKNYEVAVLVTNDSDLLTPVKIVRQELGLTVGLLNPQKRPSVVLLQYASFLKPIRAGVLTSSQFPVSLQDKNGTFVKPAGW